ncbi:unnamed protein product [Pleuronectes platessa]|uniref:Uncharacterized protein n=1 Tax=Pleuronectes platessa TaxID=8262 RepID=A0A9N7YRY9_PLEPL|nr:unnamed protein product [Pleuronectes platessa]
MNPGSNQKDTLTEVQEFVLVLHIHCLQLLLLFLPALSSSSSSHSACPALVPERDVTYLVGAFLHDVSRRRGGAGRRLVRVSAPISGEAEQAEAAVTFQDRSYTPPPPRPPAAAAREQRGRSGHRTEVHTRFRAAASERRSEAARGGRPGEEAKKRPCRRCLAAETRSRVR